MGLSGTGNDYNPGTLNKWLKNKGGISGFQINYSALSKIGLIYDGTCGASGVKGNIDKGKIVASNVHDGGHWVLSYAYNGDTILVNDPGYSTTSYPLSQIGNNHVFSPKSGMQQFIDDLKNLRMD